VTSPRREARIAQQVESLLLTLAGVICREAGGNSRTEFVSVKKEYPTEFTLEALDKLLLIITPSLLQYPEVCIRYFSLLEVILTIHPDKFAALPVATRTAVINTTTFVVGGGHTLQQHLQHNNPQQHHHQQQQQQQQPNHVYAKKCIEAGLEAMRHIGSFHLNCVTGRTKHASTLGDDVIKFQELLFDLLIFRPLSSDLLESIADALLPLIVVEVEAYQRMVAAFLERQLLHTRERLSQSFSGFLNSNGLTRDVTPQNEKRFRENLMRFVQTVRILVQYN
jgi:hypothetical protein